MSYKVKGTIVSISDKQIFDSGAGKISFRIDTGEQYNNILEFENFKGADKLEYLDSFTKYNKLGDKVEVEFNLGSNLWTNPKTNIEQCFTKLNFWKIEKIEGETQKFESEQNNEPSNNDDLPF